MSQKRGNFSLVYPSCFLNTPTPKLHGMKYHCHCRSLIYNHETVQIKYGFKIITKGFKKMYQSKKSNPNSSINLKGIRSKKKKLKGKFFEGNIRMSWMTTRGEYRNVLYTNLNYVHVNQFNNLINQ